MKKTLLFYSLAIVTAATAMAGLRHTQKAPAALDAKLEALTAKPHSPSLREIGSEIVLVSEDFAKFTAGSEDDPDGIRITLAEAAPVAVYSLDGRLLHQDNTAATEHNVALGNHGIFLVRIGAKTIKVVR